MKERSLFALKAMSSDSSSPFAGPRLHLSVPCFANASLNFLIWTIEEIASKGFKERSNFDLKKCWEQRREAYSGVGAAETAEASLSPSIESEKG